MGEISQHILTHSPFLVPLECKSVFLKTEARLSVAPITEKQNAAFKQDGGFDFSMPYPFLFEPAVAPWLGWKFGEGQIVPTGVGRGIGTMDTQVYCKLLEGRQLVNDFNTRFATNARITDSYIEQAGFVKTMLLKLRQIQQNSSLFRKIQMTGINWASSTFTYYLMAGLDEAYAVALYSTSCDANDVTEILLQQMVAPLVNYEKARKGWEQLIPVPKFGREAQQRAYHACLGFCVQRLFCPWHGARDLTKDAETGKVMQLCLNALPEGDAKVRLQKKVSAFLKGCTLPMFSSLRVDVTAQLIEWLSRQSGFRSKSVQLMGGHEM